MGGKEGVSSIVAVALMLAVLSLIIPVVISTFAIHYTKNEEIEVYREAENSFLKLVEMYPNSGRISVPLGRKTVFGFVSAAGLGVNTSGRVTIIASCSDGNISQSFSIPYIYLDLVGRTLPIRSFIFSEGGVVVRQNGSVLLSRPSTSLNYSNGTVYIAVDCLLSRPFAVSGASFAILHLKVSTAHYSYQNCTGRIDIIDELFQDVWNEVISSEGGSEESLAFTNANLSINVRYFTIEV